MDTDLTPLGELFEAAREAKRPKPSQNIVADLARTSPTTYRRIIKGVARLGGRDVPFAGAVDSIARIATVLGVTPEQLDEVGRADVAEELRALELAAAPARAALRRARGGEQEPEPPVTAEDLKDDPKLRRAVELMAEAQQLLDEIRRERRQGA